MNGSSFGRGSGSRPGDRRKRELQGIRISHHIPGFLGISRLLCNPVLQPAIQVSNGNLNAERQPLTGDPLARR